MVTDDIKEWHLQPVDKSFQLRPLATQVRFLGSASVNEIAYRHDELRSQEVQGIYRLAEETLALTAGTIADYREVKLQRIIEKPVTGPRLLAGKPVLEISPERHHCRHSQRNY